MRNGFTLPRCPRHSERLSADGVPGFFTAPRTPVRWTRSGRQPRQGAREPPSRRRQCEGCAVGAVTRHTAHRPLPSSADAGTPTSWGYRCAVPGPRPALLAVQRGLGARADAAALPADTPGLRSSLPPRSGLGLATLARQTRFSEAAGISDAAGAGRDSGCGRTHAFLQTRRAHRGPRSPGTAVPARPRRTARQPRGPASRRLRALSVRAACRGWTVLLAEAWRRPLLAARTLGRTRRAVLATRPARGRGEPQSAVPSPPRPRPPADRHPPFGLSGRCPGRHTAPSPASDRVTHAARRRGSDPSGRVFSLPLCPAVSRPGHACAEVRCESAPSTRHVHPGAGPTRPLCLVTRPTGHRTSHSPDRAHAAPEADRLQSALMRSDARARGAIIL